MVSEPKFTAGHLMALDGNDSGGGEGATKSSKIIDDSSPFFLYSSDKTGKPGSGERPVCSHCSKVGYEKAQCYELIGYLEGWGRGGRGGRGGRSGGQGGRGRGQAYANAVQGASGAGASGAGAGAGTGTGASGEKEFSISGLSDAQMQ